MRRVLLVLAGCSAAPPPRTAPVPAPARAVAKATCGPSEIVGTANDVEVRGQVVDASGASVSCAAVELSIGMEHLTAWTDAQGAYRFAGFVWHDVDLPYPELVATTRDHRASLPVRPTRDQHAYRLVVQPTGAIEGTVVGTRTHDAVVMRADTGEHLVAAIDKNGGFHRDLVPVGHYIVAAMIDPGYSEPQDVQIVEGHTASLILELPPPTIWVRLRAGHDCKSAVLRDANGTTVATMGCAGPYVKPPRVPPGSYEACVDTACRRIEIDDAHDSFEFP